MADYISTKTPTNEAESAAKRQIVLKFIVDYPKADSHMYTREYNPSYKDIPLTHQPPE